MNTDTGIGQVLGELEEISKDTFGKKYRLPIAALVSVQQSPVWARQVARALNTGENQAASELSEFEKLGALQQIPSSYDRRKVYQRVPAHPLWDFVRKTVDEAIQARDPGGVEPFWAALAERSDPDRFLEKGS
jgi:hypothetical protein